MTVWVLHQRGCEGSNIEGVFSSAEAAMEWAAKLSAAWGRDEDTPPEWEASGDGFEWEYYDGSDVFTVYPHVVDGAK